jgi:hypothetical protein
LVVDFRPANDSGAPPNEPLNLTTGVLVEVIAAWAVVDTTAGCRASEVASS